MFSARPWLGAAVSLLLCIGGRAEAGPEPSCGSEAAFRSVVGDHPVNVYFRNSRGGEIDTYWLNYGGQRVFYRRISPGQGYSQQTFVTHPWVITDSRGNCLALYLPGRAPSQTVDLH